jgi:peroxiredoxin
VDDRDEGLAVGDSVPHFRVPSSHGQTLELESFLGKVALVLFVLPGIDDATASAEVRSWDERLADFGRMRVQVLGALPDPPAVLRRFVHERELTVTLLSDESGEIRRGYAPRARVGTGLPTVVADRSGVVLSLVARNEGATHADEVFEAVERLKVEHPGALDPV